MIHNSASLFLFWKTLKITKETHKPKPPEKSQIKSITEMHSNLTSGSTYKYLAPSALSLCLIIYCYVQSFLTYVYTIPWVKVWLYSHQHKRKLGFNRRYLIIAVPDDGVTKTFGEKRQKKTACDMISKCKHFYISTADAFCNYAHLQ